MSPFVYYLSNMVPKLFLSDPQLPFIPQFLPIQCCKSPPLSQRLSALKIFSNFNTRGQFTVLPIGPCHPPKLANDDFVVFQSHKSLQSSIEIGVLKEFS